jgi:hypothetical protein
MKRKRFRHFLFGLVLGAGAVYWYSLHGSESLDTVLAWLQNEADTYRATHVTPQADSGWGPRRAE